MLCKQGGRTVFQGKKSEISVYHILEKGLSYRELDNVLQSAKDIDLLFDNKSQLYKSLNIAYIKRNVDDKKELLIANPALLTTPIVRDCDSKKCTVGNAEATWKTWM